MDHEYKKFFDMSLDLCCIAGTDAYFKMINPAFSEVLGYTFEELLSRPFLDYVHEDDQPRTLREVSRLAEGARTIQFRNRYRCKDGTYKWLSWKCQPDSASGLLYATARDVSWEVKQLEKAATQETLLDATFKLANMGRWEWRASTNRIYCSEHMLNILGLEDREDGFDVESFARFTHPDDEELLTKAFLRDPQMKGAMPFEFRFVRADGSVRTVWSDIEHAVDQDGNLISIIGAVQDITERKALELQLMQAQKLESIGELAAGVAHEINTPIQYVGDNTRFVQDAFQDIKELFDCFEALIGSMKESVLTGDMAESMEDRVGEVEEKVEEVDFEYLAEEIPRAIEQSIEGINRVARIVKAMKEFSHPGNEEKTSIDLNSSLESAVTIARNEWKYVADVRLDLTPDLPEVMCLPGELNQVFLNIIVNAAHAITRTLQTHTDEKGSITISTHDAEQWVEVRIADTGGGIPDRIKDRVFEPFFTTKDIGKGTGQGLAIAYSVVVDKHNGEIFFETEPGIGTTFFIRIPKQTQLDHVEAK